MHIFFLDESGTPPVPFGQRDKYFVIGGVIIPDSVWHRVKDSLLGMKARRKINGELKWRYFAPNNNDAANPLRDMDWPLRNEIRAEMYQIICSVKSIRRRAGNEGRRRVRPQSQRAGSMTHSRQLYGA